MTRRLATFAVFTTPVFIACAAAQPRVQSTAPPVVTFVVRDPDIQRSVSTTQVRLVAETGDTVIRMTDSSGTATFIGLRPGTYRLQVRSIGYQLFDELITLPTSCDRRVDISLRHDLCDLCEVGRRPRVSRVDVQACRPDA